jgi:hypothetical protein
MRRLPRKPLNPGYQAPKDYLAAGLATGPDRAARPELVTEHAAALGRQFLIEQIPLDAVAQALKELDVAARLASDGNAARARVLELANRPTVTRHPLLAQLFGAAAQHIKRVEDLKALVLHLKRAHTLAALSRVMMGATELEKDRAERRGAVRKHRPRG